MSGTLRLKGSTSGYSELTAPAVAGDQTFILPAVGGDILTSDNIIDLDIDAATLDGLDSTQFLRSDANDTKTSGWLVFNDNIEARFGDSSDLAIYHNGSNSFIDQVGTGNLVLKNDTADANIVIRSDDGTGGTAIYFLAEGSTGEAQLNHYGSQKLATKSTGIDVTGVITADNGTAAAPTYSFGSSSSLGMYRATADELGFATSGTERIHIDSNGLVGIGTSSPAVNLDVNGTVRAETGVLFGFDTAAANTLDDYEEGTWTGSIKGLTTAGSYTYSADTGDYTKVGNLVTVNLFLDDINTVSAGSGSARITGLPFSVKAGNYLGAARLSLWDVDAAVVSLDCAALTSSDEIAIVETRDNASASSIQITDKTSNTAYVMLSITYMTDA